MWSGWGSSIGTPISATMDSARAPHSESASPPLRRRWANQCVSASDFLMDLDQEGGKGKHSTGHRADMRVSGHEPQRVRNGDQAPGYSTGPNTWPTERLYLYLCHTLRRPQQPVQ